MFLIPFWDWIPTVITHKYYCATEAGFWVYKTPKQWKSENLGVMETLTTPRIWQHTYSDDIDVVHINQRFDLIYKKDGCTFHIDGEGKGNYKDIKTNEIVARYIDFSTGNGNIGGEPELKFWLHNDFCSGGRNNAIAFSKLTSQIKGAEK